MAKQLFDYYGDIIYFENYNNTQKPPERIDRFTINENEYTAFYYGVQPLNFNNYVQREFWRIEDAYNDFMYNQKTGDVLPYNNYPLGILAGQVFVIDYTMTDGKIIRSYYRSDGLIWNNQAVTEEFLIR